MATNTQGVLSFILIVLSILLFLTPVFIGSSDDIVFFFLLSFGFLFASFFISIAGLSTEEEFGLARFSLIISILCLCFLLIVVIGV